MTVTLCILVVPLLYPDAVHDHCPERIARLDNRVLIPDTPVTGIRYVNSLPLHQFPSHPLGSLPSCIPLLSPAKRALRRK